MTKAIKIDDSKSYLIKTRLNELEKLPFKRLIKNQKILHKTIMPKSNININK
jgi:hypothetical protein